jgi:thiol-disulfide isomerase/thioredoxin
MRHRLFMLCLSVAAAFAPGSEGFAGTGLSGLWDATIDIRDITVPFKFQIEQSHGKVQGWFFNGDTKILSTGGSLTRDHLELDFDQYARKLELTVKPDGTLDGVYEPNPPSPLTPPPPHRLPFAFHAHRAPTVAKGDANPPNIDGVWILPANSHKHDEKSWRLIVRQKGADVSAAILRIDGDTGALTGQWRDGKLTLSDFTGDNGLVLDVIPSADGALTLTLRSPFAGTDTLTGYRPDDARARNVADPSDPMTHTGVKDPNEPFAFSFPDIDGHLVSNTDPRFKGKVLIVAVSGSWCPNCHDEAPFLEEMYREYRSRGLEVVTLDFEEREQMESLARLHAFIRRYGLDYTVLVCGAPDQQSAKIPQAQGLDSWPTTFFIGRDGLVKAVHTGFAAPASGVFHEKLRQDFKAEIEALLAREG